ncbi:MAG TPA: hypothetical protein QGH56_04915 [Candidatus Marinimicrobia bacterium]|nr:hypothetical protein [Candidatus Neomarinimicrobiota bacterium]|tara:strand:+ start:3556 stop:3966 length:411 start_codon:yes stop_codon:yes gene_type:complete
MKSKTRRWLPTLGELVDRLSIHQLKEIFIPENKKNYAKEMSDIVHDIDLILKERKVVLSGDVLRAIIVLAQMNAHIWYNESQVRQGAKGADNLMLTHGLNGIRNTAINRIMEVVGGRKDYKIDCIAAEFKDWEVSW